MLATRMTSAVTGAEATKADAVGVIAASISVASDQDAAVAYSRLRPPLLEAGAGVGVEGAGDE